MSLDLQDEQEFIRGPDGRVPSRGDMHRGVGQPDLFQGLQ